jgi:hypothetical protein
LTVDTIGDASGQNADFISNLWVSPIIASASGVLQTIGVNMQTAGGNIRLKLYADSGGVPGTLLCETNSTACAVGWNDIAPTTLPSIVATTKYWLGVETDNVNPAYYYAGTSGDYYIAHTYGAGPSPYGSGTSIAVTLNMRMTYTANVAKTASDTGHGADVLQQGIPGKDVGSGGEGLANSVTFGISDSGTGSDHPRQEMDYLDNAIGGESPIWPTLRISDAGVGSDAETSSVTFSVGDSGSGADNPVEWMYYNDVSSRVHVGVAVNIFDVGFGVELITIQVTFAVSDSGAGSEVATFKVTFTAADSGFGSEAFRTGILTSDSGIGSEVPTFQVSFGVGDAGSGVEAPTEGPCWYDFGVGSETRTLLASFTVNDVALGLELFGKAFTTFDSGVGSEAYARVFYVDVADGVSGSDRFAIRVLRSGRFQYIVRLSVTENVFDTSAFDPYAYE